MKHTRFFLLLAVALALRLALMPLPDPFNWDLTTFWLPWMSYGAKHGLAQLYIYADPVVNYPPFYLALLILLGKLYETATASFAYTPLQSVLIKLPAVVADLAVGVMLYVAALRIARRDAPSDGATSRPAGQGGALLAAGLWLLSPAVIYISAYWAQVDSIHTAWMMAALLAALGRRWGWSGLLIGFGLLTKLQAIVLAPLLLFMAWWVDWRAVGRWSAAVAGVLAFSVLAALVDGALEPVLVAYSGAVGFYPALSMNAYNPWFIVQVASAGLLGQPLQDTATIVGPITLRWLGVGLLAAYGLAILWILGRRWRPRRAGWPEASQRLDVIFATGMLVFGFFILPTEMHERYIVPALAFLALPAALPGRRRLLAYLLLSGAVLLNLVRVLPFLPVVLRTFEAIPGDRVMISLAISALFVWWTWLFWRGPDDRQVAAAQPTLQGN